MLSPFGFAFGRSGYWFVVIGRNRNQVRVNERAFSPNPESQRRSGAPPSRRCVSLAGHPLSAANNARETSRTQYKNQ